MSDDFRYPHPSLPVIFCDGVESMSHSQENVKFYLSRFDPDISARGPTQLTAACQVVMPIQGFVAACLFLNMRLELLIAEGKVSQETLESIKATQREALKNVPYAS